MILTRTHKVLKKHFKPAPPAERPVLEHMLYACLLENARYEAADQALAALKGSFFDWNEIRVSTTKELAEAMSMLPEPAAAAVNLRRVLQGVFESTYSFDLESLKKQNLGQAVQKIEKYANPPPFVLGYVTQAALGGHAIPLDRGALDVLYILGALTEAERTAGTAPGIERAISKSKGVEFASLLHQLAAEVVASPMSPNVQRILLEISPDAKERLPKRGRGAKVEPVKPAVEKKPAAGAAKAAASKRAAAASPKKAARKAGAKARAAAAVGKRKPR